MDDWGSDAMELTPPGKGAVDAGFEDWGGASAAPKNDDWGKDAIVLSDKPAAAPSREPPSLTGNFWATRTGRYLQGLGEPILGTAQLASHLTGIGTEYTDRKAREAAELYKRSREDAGLTSESWDIPGGLGNLMSPVAAIPAARMARGLAAAPSVIGAAGRGAGLGALTAAQTPVSEPMSQEDYANAKLAQTLTGGAAGAVVGPAVELGAQAVLPPVLQKARELAAKGVEMTPGQLLGGFSKRAEDVLQSFPFVGDYVRNARTRSIDTFYRGAADQVLDPVGGKLPANVASGYDTVNYIDRELGHAMDQTYRGTAFRRDAQLSNDITALYNNVNRSMGAEAKKQIQREVKTILEQKTRAASRARGAGASLDSSQFQHLITQVKERERSLMSAPSDYDRQMGRFVSELRKSLERAGNRQNPTWWNDYQKVAKSYAMFTRFQSAGKNPATLAYEGVFTPTQLGSAVVSMDPTLRKGAVSKGEAFLQKYAGAGKDILPSKVPDSGTPERGYLMGLLTGHLPMSMPHLLGVGAGVGGLYSEPAQRALRKYLLSNTASQQAIASALRQAAYPMLTERAGQAAAEGFADGGDVSPDSPMFDMAGVAARADVPPLPTKKEAAMRSFITGLTAGAWPYIEAAGKMAAGEGEGKSYDDMRREAQARVRSGEQEFPEATERAQLFGGMVPLGGAAKAGLGPAIARGAGYGGLSGYLGPSEPDLVDVEGRAGSAGIGALLGGLGAGTANIASTAGRNMLRGEYPFALGEARNTLGSGLGGIGEGKPKLGDLTPEEKKALGLDVDPWGHMKGAPKTAPAPQPAPKAEPAPTPDPMMERVNDLVTDAGKKLMPSSNFHAPTAIRFVHPESELARWYGAGDISGTDLYAAAKNAISGVKAFAGFLKGAGKSTASAQEFIDWARSRHEPFSNNPRENRLLHSIQDAEAAGYVTLDPTRQGEWVRLTPLGEAALDRFKNTRFAEGGGVYADYSL